MAVLGNYYQHSFTNQTPGTRGPEIHKREGSFIDKNMSQQYALPMGPPHVADSALSNFATPHPPPDPSQQQQQQQQQQNPSTSKKRKAPKPKALGDLRRVTSLPQIRNLAMPEGGPISPNSDKRRNKLGYHRTSVACGHCRRRKIRCLLPSPEDPQGRCANCIRLKKECQFYSVTEAPQHERVGAKKSGPPTASNSPSPRGSRIPGNSDEGEAGAGYPLGPPLEDQAYTASPISSSVSGGVYPDPQYSYPSYPASESWHSETFPSPNTAAQQHARQEPPSPYWTDPRVPHPSAYQTGQSARTGQPGATEFASRGFHPPQPPQGWVQPRSMSLGHVEHLPQHYPYQTNFQHPGVQAMHQPYHPQYSPTQQPQQVPPSDQQGYAYQAAGWQPVQPGADAASRQYYPGQIPSPNQGPSPHGQQYGGYYPPASHSG